MKNYRITKVIIIIILSTFFLFLAPTCPPCKDADKDKICDTEDNCIYIPNPDQKDTDSDNVGDLCDNCIYVPNFDQKDSNEDGIGDACDFIGIYVTPEEGFVGSKVKIIASNESLVIENPRVFFSGIYDFVEADILSYTENEIEVKVPKGAITGYVKVKINEDYELISENIFKVIPSDELIFVINSGDRNLSVINVSNDCVIKGASFDEPSNNKKGIPKNIISTSTGAYLAVGVDLYDSSTSSQLSGKVSILSTSIYGQGCEDILNPQDSIIFDILVEKRPEAMVFSSNDRYLFVANRNSNSLSVIDMNLGEVIITVLVGKKPIKVKLSSDDKILYVLNQDSSDLWILDAEKLIMGEENSYILQKIELKAPNLDSTNIPKDMDITANGAYLVILLDYTISGDYDKFVLLETKDIPNMIPTYYDIDESCNPTTLITTKDSSGCFLCFK